MRRRSRSVSFVTQLPNGEVGRSNGLVCRSVGRLLCSVIARHLCVYPSAPARVCVCDTRKGKTKAWQHHVQLQAGATRAHGGITRTSRLRFSPSPPSEGSYALDLTPDKEGYSPKLPRVRSLLRQFDEAVRRARKVCATRLSVVLRTSSCADVRSFKSTCACSSRLVTSLPASLNQPEGKRPSGSPDFR